MNSKTGSLVWLTVVAIGSGMLGGWLSAWLLAQSAEAAHQVPSPGSAGQVLTAREIRLVDEQGRIWARMGSSEAAAQHRGLILNDESGQERLRLAVSAEGNGGLVLSDAQGRFRAALTVSSTGIPGVALTDQSGGMRFLLLVAQEGSPQMDLYDGQGRIGLGLEVSEKGDPELRMSRAAPDFRVARLDASSLEFQTEGFRRALQIGVDEQQSGRIQLFDSQGELSADLPGDDSSGSQ
ncbi:MAG: hypothetical protein V3T83_06495 [Acidobacteriota bacterium]